MMMLTPMLTLALTLVVTLGPGGRYGGPEGHALHQDPHAQMHARGAKVMGFDQDKTAHHFFLYADGGAIDVSVKDATDTVNRDAIRAHLPHIAKLFADGNFDAPLAVHATSVPGTSAMAARKDRITWKYIETDRGGRVDVVATDAEALAALHSFLRFQITDHKTGDALAITKRPDRQPL